MLHLFCMGFCYVCEAFCAFHHHVYVVIQLKVPFTLPFLAITLALAMKKMGIILILSDDR